jgi:hypothetical protein
MNTELGRPDWRDCFCVVVRHAVGVHAIAVHKTITEQYEHTLYCTLASETRQTAETDEFLCAAKCIPSEAL